MQKDICGRKPKSMVVGISWCGVPFIHPGEKSQHDLNAKTVWSETQGSPGGKPVKGLQKRLFYHQDDNPKDEPRPNLKWCSSKHIHTLHLMTTENLWYDLNISVNSPSNPDELGLL